MHYIGYQEITGERVEAADLVAALCPLRRSEALRIIAWASAVANSRDGLRPEGQMFIANELLHTDLRDRLARLVRDDQAWGVFHRQQLLFVAQMALLCCQEKTAPCDEGQLKKAVGRCCLMANDVIGEDESDLSDPLSDDASAADREEWLITKLMPLHEFHRATNWQDLVGRASRRPLLELFPSQFACLDLGLLQWVFADGIYWLLREAFASQEKFTQLFGHIFEAYIDRLIGRFTYSEGTLAKTYYPNPKFTDGAEVCDGILRWTRTIALMECKAGILTTRQKFAGDKDATLSGIDDMLARDEPGKKKGIGQLADSLARIVSGECPFPEGAQLKDCRLLPLLVVYDEAFTTMGVRIRVDRKLREALAKRNAPQERVGPLLILSVGDVENLERLAATKQLESVLTDYAQRVATATPPFAAGGFHDFLYNEFGGGSDSGDKSLVRETAQTVFDECLADLRRRSAQAGPS
jgi:hypothetical protein